MKENYQHTMEGAVATLKGRPTLLLHSCCAPCSSYVLECLLPHFAVTLFYCNSCISPEAEHARRLAEQARLLAMLPQAALVRLESTSYDHARFLEAVRGLESEPEGGARCTVCFRQRMEETARYASVQGFDFFASTLTVSPHKDAVRLNAIGRKLAEEQGVAYLVSDFKKKDGYKRSIALSRQYNLYRQDYCGCEFSQAIPCDVD